MILPVEGGKDTPRGGGKVKRDGKLGSERAKT